MGSCGNSKGKKKFDKAGGTTRRTYYLESTPQVRYRSGRKKLHKSPERAAKKKNTKNKIQKFTHIAETKLMKKTSLLGGDRGELGREPWSEREWTGGATEDR